MREPIVIAALVALATFAGARYVRTFRGGGERPSFYQEMFAPAVMQVCGRGFVNVTERNLPSLEAFLATRTDAFDCHVLPAVVTSIPLTPMQQVHRYLLMAASACWRVLGVRWSALDWLTGGLFALTTVALYLACRLAAGTIVSVVLSMLAIMSPLQLANLPHIRDYSKAPFFVATGAALVWLMTPRRPKRIVALAIAIGVLLGFGMGFRTDVMLYFVPCVAGLLACSPEASASPWRVRVTAVAVFVTAAVAVAWPILRTYSEGQNLWHVALLGLATPFDGPEHLGIRRSLYDFGDQYLDQYIHSVVNNYWMRVHHGSVSTSALYATSSGEYYRRLFLTFPADFATRAWAAVLRSFAVPVDLNAVRAVPFGISAEWLRRLFWSRWWVFSRLQPLALPMVMVVAVALSARRRLAAVFLVAFVVLSAGVTSLQFEGRHNFHIELIAYWIFAAACGGLVTIVSGFTHQSVAASSRRDVRMMPAVGFALSLVAAVVLPIVVLRAYQSRTVSALLGAYDSAPVSPIDVHERTSEGVTHFEMPSLNPTSAESSTQVLVTTLDADSCRRPLDLTFRYANDVRGMPAFTRLMQVDLGASGRQTKVIFPAYFTNVQFEGRVSFVGLEFSDTDRRCIRSVSRFSDPDAFALLLTTTLPGDWRTQLLYQRLESIESR